MEQQKNEATIKMEKDYDSIVSSGRLQGDIPDFYNFDIVPLKASTECLQTSDVVLEKNRLLRDPVSKRLKLGDGVTPVKDLPYVLIEYFSMVSVYGSMKRPRISLADCVVRKCEN